MDAASPESVPVKPVLAPGCTNVDCDRPGDVWVADGVLLCAEDALEWVKRARPPAARLCARNVKEGRP